MYFFPFRFVLLDHSALKMLSFQTVRRGEALFNIAAALKLDRHDARSS